MSLRRGHLDIDWTTLTSRRYFERVRRTMSDVADALGGEFHDNPLWWTRRVITVHPLGGAPMGRHPAEGVCDSYGEVFGHPGLYVLDGAALPGPVGANPSLTIAAFADRACHRILEQPLAPRAASASAPTVAGAATTDGERPTSLSFTEEMKGHIALDVADPHEGQALGRARNQRLMFRLTITADDVDRFVADPLHQAGATGHVECDVLGGRLPVEKGWFNLFTRDDDPSRRRMLYRLHLRDPGGNPLTLVGHKEVHDDPGFDIWSDTSTLYVRMVAGHVTADGDEHAPLLGTGIIVILAGDFAQQLTTFRASGPHPARALQSFGRLFLGELWDVYGSHFTPTGERA